MQIRFQNPTTVGLGPCCSIVPHKNKDEVYEKRRRRRGQGK
jgi:hypothetical protein